MRAWPLRAFGRSDALGFSGLPEFGGEGGGFLKYKGPAKGSVEGFLLRVTMKAVMTVAVRVRYYEGFSCRFPLVYNKCYYHGLGVNTAFESLGL